jgi:hypothetical protein
MNVSKNGPVTHSRRSEEDRIRALEAQIEALKQRKVRKLQRRDPALKHMHAAVRSIDKAMSENHDAAARQGLADARSTLTACLALTSTAPKGTLVPQPRRSVGGVSEDALLSHVRQNPGHRGEQIATALGTDTATVRPVMKRLIRAGRVKTAGQARAMSYSAA